jgi:small-conductance mechanosensitive channel
VIALFADCVQRGTGSHVFWAVVAIGIVIGWALISWAAIWHGVSPEERFWLLLVFVLSAVGGAAILLVPGGFTGNHNYLARFFVSLAVTGLVGVLAAVGSRRFGPGRALIAAVGGDVLVPGAAVVLLFWVFGVEGACLD